MRTIDLIAKKRDGGTLEKAEIEYLLKGYLNGFIPDYQISSLLMAIYFRGMNDEETALFTQAMFKSGDQFNFSNITKPKIDKHSTGGVGDKISLIVAPLAAACGLAVPMLCGRGLGHTGGTIDKLESIPGYRTELTERDAEKILENCGFCFMAQTPKVAPADRLLYALRDVTATVESISLITASILSKKLAEGADGFVFDVKTGKGAFMKTKDQAKLLAQSLLKTAKSLGKKACALLTGMDQPLGSTIGNLIELEEAYSALQGNWAKDINELSFALTTEMLLLGGLVNSQAEGKELCSQKIADGSALKLFLKNVELQGGKINYLLDIPNTYKQVKKINLKAEHTGYINKIDAYSLGLAAMLLGAGRKTKESQIDHLAGIRLFSKVGDRVKKGDDLVLVYYSKNKDPAKPLELIKKAFVIQDELFNEQETIVLERLSQ